ncbi:MAG: type IV conjugative transfer system protein TraL [Comamonadaceae bacterium]|nr:type IV conjugative transfer system protein TraL [Comamonadaceae bacterium]
MPWKIGFWDADVAAPVLFCFFVGYMSGSQARLRAAAGGGDLTSSRWSEPHQGRQAPGLRHPLGVLASAGQPRRRRWPRPRPRCVRRMVG